MKYQCVKCDEVFNEDEIVMVGIGTGWNFYTVTVFCNGCFGLYQKSKKSCYECKYRKTKRKHEPCKSCKEHINWKKNLEQG